MTDVFRRSDRSRGTPLFRQLDRFALILLVAFGSAALGADPPPRRRSVMRPPPLQLSAPVVPSPLISGVEAVIPLPHTYSGSGDLVFHLVEGGTGMTVGTRNGVLRWTPPVAAEGSTTAVRVEATDGQLRSSVTFGLPVAASSPLPVSVAGQTVTVGGPGTLAGIALTIPSDATLPPSILNASRVEPRDAPGLPPGFTRISDYFRLTPASSGDSPITLSIPKGLVPAGTAPQQVRLMVHTDATTEAEQREWLAVWKHLDVRPDGSITIDISTLGELFTIAIADPPQSSVSKSRAVSEAGVTCVPVELSNGATDASRQVCTVSTDPALTFIVKDHARADWGPVASPPEIAGWLAAARDAALETGLFCRTSLEVVIEPTTSSLGFVSSIENFEVLHINSSAMARDALQGTLVHELFHHAQSNTVIRERNNLIRECGPGCNWIIEGTARWFEDIVFDELDTYRVKEPSPLPPILSAGLDAWPDAGRLASRPYSRFAFFKLLSSRCPSLDVAQMVNAELAFDPTGIEALAESLDRWECHFADGLTGAWHDSLEAALLEYVYATIGENSMPWLDDDENGFDFANSDDLIRPDRDCKVSGLCPSRSVTSGTMPPSSAFGIRVAAVESLPDHSEAAIVLRSSNGSLIAWVGNDEEGTLDDGQ